MRQLTSDVNEFSKHNSTTWQVQIDLLKSSHLQDLTNKRHWCIPLFISEEVYHWCMQTPRYYIWLKSCCPDNVLRSMGQDHWKVDLNEFHIIQYEYKTNDFWRTIVKDRTNINLQNFIVNFYLPVTWFSSKASVQMHQTSWLSQKDLFFSYLFITMQISYSIEEKKSSFRWRSTSNEAMCRSGTKMHSCSNLK